MKKELNKQFWNLLLEKGTKLEVHTADFSMINKDSFKKLRNELNFSQSKFAEILGVSKKAIEKWEQGVNPIQGPVTRLIYLFQNDHKLIDQFYMKILINDSHNLYSKSPYSICIYSNIHTASSALSNAKYPKQEMDKEGGYDIWQKTLSNQCLAS